jgi:hypothetical protein
MSGGYDLGCRRGSIYLQCVRLLGFLEEIDLFAVCEIIGLFGGDQCVWLRPKKQEASC